MLDGCCVCSFPDATLSIDNICRRIGEIDCMKENGLGYNLRVPSNVLSEFEQFSQDPTKDTISYWLSADPSPSWRRLLMALEESNERKAVGNVKEWVEELTGEFVCILLMFHYFNLGPFRPHEINSQLYLHRRFGG